MVAELNVRRWSIALVVVCMTLGFASWTLVWRFVAGGESQQTLEAAQHVTDALTTNVRLVQELTITMSGSPGIVSGDAFRPVSEINAVLDRYAASFGIDVAYVMDAKGIVLASSNRNTPDSFVGKDFLFRPYASQALAGRAAQYFARGSVTDERGVYAGAPIRGDTGVILGVVAAKINALEYMEALLAHDPAFVVSPEGVIFLSSRPELALTAFTPISPAAQQALLESKQFGSEPIPPSNIEVSEHDGVPVMVIDGVQYVYGSDELNEDGWRVVLGYEPTRVLEWRSIILGLLLFALLVGGILLRTLQVSVVQRRLAQSTALFRRVFSEGLVGQALCDAAGKCATSNAGFLNIIGASAEELYDRSISDFVQGKDEAALRETIASVFSGEGKPLERTIQFVRADGSSVWVRATVSAVGGKADREAILLQLVDITSLERRARNLEKRAEELESLNAMILQRAEQQVMQTPAPSERSPEQNKDSPHQE